MPGNPENIGIKAIEIYFPSQCVDQAKLEKYDGVGQGKYTIGLGQTKMSFCDDREDVYSLALTTVSSLLRKYNINPTSIGRLEVGTESMLDKSKSVKSVLMQLFEPSGNTNVEGVDTINACYGGTNALFNTLNWINSQTWDGRDAIVVAADIALYKKGPARPTGGAGCVVMLVGPDAPLVFEPVRGSFMSHVYDFYKPDFTSEYPIVDGRYSQECYTEALDHCYDAYNNRKTMVIPQLNGQITLETELDQFDFMVFHTPTCKLVAKSYARLLYNDFRRDPTGDLFATLPAELLYQPYNKAVEKNFIALAQKRFAYRVQPSLELATQCGNMYCASVFSSLVSLLCNASSSEVMQGKRIGIFSYGSGLASSMFSLRVDGDFEQIRNQLDLHKRLEKRKTVSPEIYDDMCTLREKAHLKKGYYPAGDVATLAPGTYFLASVDNMFRRSYGIKD